jgi:hypothetical protein
MPASVVRPGTRSGAPQLGPAATSRRQAIQKRPAQNRKGTRPQAFAAGSRPLPTNKLTAEDEHGPGTLERLNLPRPAIVETNADTGEPCLVQRNGRQLRVASVQNQWRIDDEWWREPISRHYYLLDLAGSALLTVFHDLITNTWWEQRA